MAKGKKKQKTKTVSITRRYESLHRYLAGLIIVCFIITVIGSFIAGNSADWVFLKGLAVICVVGIAGRILIKLWVAWDSVNEGAMNK